MGLLSFVKWPWSGNGQPATLEAALAAALRTLADAADTLNGELAARQIALNVIVPQMASLTIGAWDRESRRRDKGRLASLLNYELFGPDITGFTGWSALYRNLFASNNAYARIIRVGKTRRLVPLTRDRVQCTVNHGVRSYKIDGKDAKASDVFHLMLNTYDGLVGVPYDETVNVFKLAAEAETMALRFFSQGGNVRRIWRLLDGCGPRQEKAAQEFLDAAIKGRLKQHIDLVVPSHVDKVEDIQGNNRDGQLLETRAAQDKQILAMYGIDMGNLDLERVYNLAIVPALEQTEQAVNHYLLTADEKATYKVGFVVAGRFRGSMKEQAEFANTSLSFMSINEVREWFNLPRLGPEYDAVVNPHTASAGVNEQRQALASGAVSDGSNE